MEFIKNFLFVALIFVNGTAPARAMNIWPTNPYLVLKKNDNSKSYQPNSALLFLDNGKKENIRYQVRIFRWTQNNNQDVYQQQEDIQPQPPIIDFYSDKKQVVRLMQSNQPNSSGYERAYRLIIDEIPSTAVKHAGIQFRMRLVIPFFVYSDRVDADYIPGVSGIPKKTPATSWKIMHQGGEDMVEIKNNGLVHLRLSDVFFTHKGSTTPVFEVGRGLLGYVLPGQSMQFKLKNWSLGKGKGLSLYSSYGEGANKILSNE